MQLHAKVSCMITILLHALKTKTFFRLQGFAQNKIKMYSHLVQRVSIMLQDTVRVSQEKLEDKASMAGEQQTNVYLVKHFSFFSSPFLVSISLYFLSPCVSDMKKIKLLSSYVLNTRLTVCFLCYESCLCLCSTC